MKVLLVNGSPHEKGCTYTALAEVAGALNARGVETEILQLGVKPVPGCLDCGACGRTGRCVREDLVNSVIDDLDNIDGFVFGSPVYYAGPSGQIKCFLDRLFFAAGRRMATKPGAAVVSCRRGGASTAFDQLNKYFSISSMPVVGSIYWNQVHGFTPEEVRQDLEGMQTMRQLGENMAWLLSAIRAGRAAGNPEPVFEKRIMTNFIR